MQLPNVRRVAPLVIALILSACATGDDTVAVGSGIPVPEHYELDLHWGSENHTLRGTEAITLRNDGDGVLPVAWLRLWPNGWKWDRGDEPGGCEHPRIQVTLTGGGRAADAAASCSAIAVELDAPLRPGDRTTIELRFRVRVPNRDDRFGRRDGLALLGNAVPVLAVRDAVGWHLDPYSVVGEAGYSLAASWRAQLRLGAGESAATTGNVVSDSVAGTERVIVVETAHARDFALVIGPMRIHVAIADGVVLRAFGPPAVGDAGLDRALRSASDTMRVMQAWYGAYGSPELDLVVLRDSYAYEYPELVVTTPDRETVAHEVAHQWWYGIVGNDQYREPWLDESFSAWNEEQLTPGTYDCDPDHLGVGHALTRGMDHYERAGFSRYEGAVYDGGECALERLERDLGRDAFLGLLGREVERFRYGVVHTPDFLALVKEVSPAVEQQWAALLGFPP